MCIDTVRFPTRQLPVQVHLRPSAACHRSVNRRSCAAYCCVLPADCSAGGPRVQHADDLYYNRTTLARLNVLACRLHVAYYQDYRTGNSRFTNRNRINQLDLIVISRLILM